MDFVRNSDIFLENGAFYIIYVAYLILHRDQWMSKEKTVRRPAIVETVRSGLTVHTTVTARDVSLKYF